MSIEPMLSAPADFAAMAEPAFVLTTLWLSLSAAAKGGALLRRSWLKGLFTGGLVVSGLISLVSLVLLQGMIHLTVPAAPTGFQARLVRTVAIEGDFRP